jgi:hypothetical protein
MTSAVVPARNRSTLLRIAFRSIRTSACHMRPSLLIHRAGPVYS